MSADEIVSRWKRWRSRIEEALERVVAGITVAEAIGVARYIVAGGKRFRGFLVVLVAEELGGRGEDALDAAVAVELVHASSLALDDIIDSDTVRRGKPAAWVAFGIPRTVMVSNLLIPLAQLIVAKRYGAIALERTVTAWLNTSLGEVYDAFYSADELPRDSYTRIARLKTGSLFRLAAELGAIAAGREDLLQAAGSYGEALGYAYQVADDLVDLALEARGRSIKPSTGYMLFKKLVGGSTEEGLRMLRKAVSEASRAAEKLPGARLLPSLPSFMANAMLQEAGLSLAS
jgi:geranylgeranyl pyrophosphate synthase